MANLRSISFLVLMKSILVRFIVILLLITASKNNLYSQFYSEKKFSIEQGLPHNTILWVNQDESGNLWILHKEGLTKYDGHTLKNYFSPKPLVWGSKIFTNLSGNLTYSEDPYTFELIDDTIRWSIPDSSFLFPEENNQLFSQFSKEGISWFVNDSISFCFRGKVYPISLISGAPKKEELFFTDKYNQPVLVISNTGDAFIQGKNAIFYFNKGSFVRIPTPTFTTSINRMFNFKSDEIWLVFYYRYENPKENKSEIIYYKDKKWNIIKNKFDKRILINNPYSFYKSTSSPNDNYFVLQDTLYQLNNKKQAIPVLTKMQISAYFPLKDGSLLLLNQDFDYYIFQNDVLNKIKTNTQGYFSYPYIDNENNIWSFSQNGLIKFSESRVSFNSHSKLQTNDKRLSNYYLSNAFFKLQFIDNKNNIYLTSKVFSETGVGYKGENIIRISGDSVILLAEPDQIGFLNTIIESNDGEIYFYTNKPKEKEICIWSLSENNKTLKQLKNFKNVSVDNSKFKNIIFSNSDGVYEFDNSGVNTQANDRIEFGIKFDSLVVKKVENENKYFIFSYNKCYLFDPYKKNLSAYGKITAEVKLENLIIYKDKQGKYIALVNDPTSLVYDENDQINLFTISAKIDLTNGEYSPLQLPRTITKIEYSSDGTIWLLDYQKGVWFFNLETTQSPILISRTNGLTSIAIRDIHTMSPCELWVSSSQGLCKISIDSTHISTKFSIDTLGIKDGITDLDCYSIIQKDNRYLLVGTSSGVLTVDTKKEIVNSTYPKTELINFYWQLGDSIYTDKTIPHNFNPLVITFNGICLTEGTAVRYRYMLEGYDNKWVEQSESVVRYSSLPPGQYTFKVKSCNNNGLWSKEFQSISFTILSAWYRTWTFYISIILLFSILIVFYFRWRTAELKKRNKDLELKVVARTNEIELQKDELLHQKEIIEEKQKEILDSINYAKRIQYALLAHEQLLTQSLPDHFVYFLPKDIVSGDFYWAYKIDHLFFLAVCDSTGHGIPGAFMSLLNISFLNEAINEKKIYDTGKVLDHVREQLIKNISQDGGRDGMDGILLCLDEKNNKFTYSAAYNSPILIRNGELINLPFDKMPVGSGERNDNFNTYQMDCQKGDRIYLYTDGYADQFGGPKGKKFKYTNLNKILIEIAQDPTDLQHKFIDNTFQKWRGDLEQVDDVTVIGILL